jgi:hypothetical protein
MLRMRFRHLAILVILWCCFILSSAQTQPETQDVIRTETNLVQTGISVVDKKGNFIDGLRLEDFELKIDGKVQPLTFLTRLTAGTNRETREFNKARSNDATNSADVEDLTKSKLTLSTLLLRRQSPVITPAKSTTELPFSVDRRFSKSSQLGFFLFIYNANKGSTAPDLTAQVEIFRQGRSVVATPARKLSMEGMTDLARIPYAGQFPLASLPSGRYELQVTISDKAVNTTAIERVRFEVE